VGSHSDWIPGLPLKSPRPISSGVPFTEVRVALGIPVSHPRFHHHLKELKAAAPLSLGPAASCSLVPSAGIMRETGSLIGDLQQLAVSKPTGLSAFDHSNPRLSRTINLTTLKLQWPLHPGTWSERSWASAQKGWMTLCVVSKGLMLSSSPAMACF